VTEAVKAQAVKIKATSNMSADDKLKLGLAIEKINTKFHADFHNLSASASPDDGLALRSAQRAFSGSLGPSSGDSGNRPSVKQSGDERVAVLSLRVRRSLLGLAALVSVAAAALSSIAGAQGTLPDIVRTKEQISIADAVNAGAADKDSSSTKPYATIHAENAHVEFHATEEGLTFLDADAGGYSRLCTAPCNIDVPAGYHRFGLSKPESKVVASGEDDIEVRYRTVVSGRYVDRSDARTLGLILAINSPVAGIAMIIRAVAVDPQPRVDGPLLAGGIVTLAGGLLTGLILVNVKDVAIFQIESGAAAVAQLPGWATPRREGAVFGAVPGLTATLRL
jgi:hypothetical protein